MNRDRITNAVREILLAVGEDPDREGLLETPDRVYRMYAEIFSGLGKTAEDILSKTFEMVDGSMVIEMDIPFFSMCEHHLLPFYGKAHIAYMPDDRVAGLSKLARTVDLYSRKPQLQERLNVEIATAIMDYLGAKGSFVILEAEHMCMNMRGVKKPGTVTRTVISKGVFEEDESLRNEAYRLMGF